jgi:hypothetical protein
MLKIAGRGQSSRCHEETDDRVMSFRAWCELNGFSLATGRRVINAGTGPVVVQLSPRRIGVTIRANREWQASRTRGE